MAVVRKITGKLYRIIRSGQKKGGGHLPRFRRTPSSSTHLYAVGAVAEKFGSIISSSESSPSSAITSDVRRAANRTVASTPVHLLHQIASRTSDQRQQRAIKASTANRDPANSLDEGCKTLNEDWVWWKTVTLLEASLIGNTRI
ncbi:hypothetical protein ACLOJK_004883 [Asimina triloba]